jgi:hypothetical protein
MPIAASILNDLLDRCNNYLQAYDAARSKAFISVTLSEKRPQDQKPAADERRPSAARHNKGRVLMAPALALGPQLFLLPLGEEVPSPGIV